VSIRLQSQVWEECTDVSGTKLLLLLALADFADDQCQCFPKIKTLAGRIRTDERVTRKHMKELKELGYVEVLDDSSGRRSNVYKVHVNPVKIDRSKKTGQKRQVTSDRSNPVKFDTPPYLYNEPSIEPSITPQTPQGAGGMSYEDYYTEILDLYHEHCPSLPPVRNLNDKRKKLIRQRLSEGYTIADFAQAFRNTEADDFMTGKNDRKWKANIDYILRNGKEDKFLQLLEATPTATPTQPEPQYFEPANRSDILMVFPDRTDLVDTPWSELTPDVQQVITEKCKEL